MAHQQQRDFCLSVKRRFPEFFKEKWVLDIGSLDINGNNQYLFEDSGYIGLDLLPGDNVDLTSKGHEIQLPDESFDVIISTECFEHDPFYEQTIKNIVRMLKPGGLFIFSCATVGRPEHGTRRTTPLDAPLTHEFGDWGDYYKNLEECDIRAFLNVDEFFSRYEFSSQHESHDLYFWGVKRGDAVKRKNYSFLMRDTPTKIKINELEKELEKANSALKASEDQIKSKDIIQQKIMLDLERIYKSNSWRVTRPFRFFARLLRGEFKIAFGSLARVLRLPQPRVSLGSLRNGFLYVARGDFEGLRDRWASFKKERNQTNHVDMAKYSPSAKWGILSPPHTLFVAHLVARRLNFHGFDVEIITSEQKEYTRDLYIVICPQMFKRLPEDHKRIAFQMEQSVSSRWFTRRYLSVLKNSLAVLEYSLCNIKFLEEVGIGYPHVHYLPIGASRFYGDDILADQKKYDVLFYGDSLSSARRTKMLGALKQRFNVKVLNNLFGSDLLREVKRSRVVLNIHYYENALLEMPRIQECLSLGVPVVSESAKDQNDYPELLGAVTFFEEGSIDAMIAAVGNILTGDEKVTSASVEASEKRFAFMFDRFLVALGCLSFKHVIEMPLPLPDNAAQFALSLPETIDRRRAFEQIRPFDCIVFEGIRMRHSWVGCGLSYQALARHVLKNGLTQMTVMEDDVILPTSYSEDFDDIRSFLKINSESWDVFAGVIADLHPDVNILSVERYKGKTFVTINKMTSMVFNIYASSALNILSNWNAEDSDAQSNTIDRYLENQKNLRVIVVLPYFVGHREEVYSTLWGFKNSRYSNMIAESQRELNLKVDEYLSKLS